MSETTTTTGEVSSISLEGYKEHNIKKARLQSTLAALLEDPILSDIPKKPSLSDVDTLLNLEFGSAMRINVLKLDSTSFGNAQTLSETFCQFEYVKEIELFGLMFVKMWR